MTTPDYKALCAELTDALTAHGPMTGALPLLIRARAALAEGEKGPSDEELLELMHTRRLASESRCTLALMTHPMKLT